MLGARAEVAFSWACTSSSWLRRFRQSKATWPRLKQKAHRLLGFLLAVQELAVGSKSAVALGKLDAKRLLCLLFIDVVLRGEHVLRNSGLTDLGDLHSCSGRGTILPHDVDGFLEGCGRVPGMAK